MGLIMIFCTGDLIWVSLDSGRVTTWVVSILNVALILFFIRAIREVWIQFTKVLIKSVPVFIIILAYFLIFVIIGFILFGQNTDNLAFATITSSMYTVFILFTVSNYPDVSMSYFEENRLTMIYFWAYLLIGIFLLSNLLLAQIFINYKSLIENRLSRYEQEVDMYIHEMFDAIAGNDKIKAAAEERQRQREENQGESGDEEELQPLVEHITTEKMVEVMGGRDVVDSEKRLSDMIW